MRCRHVEKNLRALVDGELAPGESRTLLRHMERCAGCRETYRSIQAVASALQAQTFEEVPAHFAAGLQVRLARHRQERAAADARSERPGWVARLLAWPRPARWAGGLSLGTAVAAAVLLLVLPRGIGAEEVTRRAAASWLRIRNYGCRFVSRGVYQGQPRTFRQTQFFRRPGEFRLDTAQDYPLTTWVYADRVIHYLRGGDWEGRGPLVIIRPRRQGEDALPFPFGVTWQGDGNVSLDHLIRQLSEHRDARLVGTEVVADRECYRLHFESESAASREPEQYDVWIDTESFLPRRVRWFRDPQNHIVTEAAFLQVNYDVLPADTFVFEAPEGARIIRGDMDPHVLALPVRPARTEAFASAPVESGEREAWRLAGDVPFPVLAPRWLPDGYELVRARRKIGRWVDLHWLRDDDSRAGTVIKLVQQDGSKEVDSLIRSGGAVRIVGRSGAIMGRIVRRSEPYQHLYLSWRQGGTRCTLFASGIEASDALRIAGSLVVATSPPRIVRAGSADVGRGTPSAEPSLIPTETESALAQELPARPPDETAPPSGEATPMMPEMPDPSPPGG